MVAGLEEKREEVFLYGKKQVVLYRTAICLAKFMKGKAVRAVWMQFEDSSGKLSKTRLLLATSTELSAKEIFTFYARRWAIEDLFNQMKNNWGVARGLAAITTSSASMDADFICCIRITSTSGDL